MANQNNQHQSQNNTQFKRASSDHLQGMHLEGEHLNKGVVQKAAHPADKLARFAAERPIQKKEEGELSGKSLYNNASHENILQKKAVEKEPEKLKYRWYRFPTSAEVFAVEEENADRVPSQAGFILLGDIAYVANGKVEITDYEGGVPPDVSKKYGWFEASNRIRNLAIIPVRGLTNQSELIASNIHGTFLASTINITNAAGKQTGIYNEKGEHEGEEYFNNTFAHYSGLSTPYQTSVEEATNADRKRYGKILEMNEKYRGEGGKSIVYVYPPAGLSHHELTKIFDIEKAVEDANNVLRYHGLYKYVELQIRTGIGAKARLYSNVQTPVGKRDGAIVIGLNAKQCLQMASMIGRRQRKFIESEWGHNPKNMKQADDGTNPETTMTDSSSRKSINFAVISLTGLENAMTNDKGIFKGQLNHSEVLMFTMLHVLGHNAGIAHGGGGDTGTMMDGDKLPDVLENRKKKGKPTTLTDLAKMTKEVNTGTSNGNSTNDAALIDNTTYIEKVKEHFKSKKGRYR